MDQALPAAPEGLLADTAARIGGDADESAFVLIERAEDALLWRLALIDSATESLDLQYSIWKGDEAGALLFSRLIEAAARGVRVRFLVDEFDLDVDERELAELDQHTSVAINFWNADARPMLDRLLLADGRFAVVGGRNVANEHFGLDDRFNFLDLEVLAAGPVVADLGDAFDSNWISEPSISIARLVRATTLSNLARFAALGQERLEHSALLGRISINAQDWAERFEYLPERWNPGTARWIEGDRAGVAKLTATPVHDELLVVAACLVPVAELLASLERLVADGVTVTVVTGSMGATNHIAVYAHYRKHIGTILEAGAELYEVDGRPMAALREAAETPPAHGKYVAMGLSGLVGDRSQVFVGSVGFDARALVVNPEGGLFIESPGLGDAVAAWYRVVTAPGNAWRLTKDPSSGTLTWTSGDEVRDSSPDRGPTQRFVADLLESLPIRSRA